MFIYSINMKKYSVNHVKSMLQDEIYCTWVINKVKKIFIYIVNKNIRKCSVMHVKSMLLRIIILAVQKIHLNKVYFLKNRISQSEFENLKKHDDEMLTYKNHNVVEKQLNFVAETVDWKQFISCTIVKVLIIHKITYNFSSKFIVKLIKILQQENEFAVKLKADKMMNIQKNDVEA